MPRLRVQVAACGLRYDSYLKCFGVLHMVSPGQRTLTKPGFFSRKSGCVQSWMSCKVKRRQLRHTHGGSGHEPKPKLWTDYWPSA